MNPRRVVYVLNIFPKLSETFIAGEIAELRRRNVDILILSLRAPREEPRHEFIAKAGLEELTHYDVPAFSELIGNFDRTSSTRILPGNRRRKRVPSHAKR